MSWKNTPLSDLAMPTGGSFVDGPFGSNMKASEYEAEGVPIIRLQNIRPNEFLTKDIKFVSSSKAAELSRHRYAPGDLVISKLGDPPGYACVVPPSAGSGIIVADVVRFRGDPELIDHRYLSFYLNSPGGRQQFLKLSKGTTRTRVNLTSIKTIEIPRPPTLDEQKRVAALLDKADALRRQREESLQLTETLLRSVFIEMFGDPATNAKDFPVRKLGEFFSSRKEGAKCGPFGSALKKSDSQQTGVPVWGIDNISTDGRFVDEVFTRISNQKYEDLKGYEATNGDILISRAGTVGKMCVLCSTEKNGIIGSNLIRLRLNADFLSPYWFVAFMKYCKGRVARLRAGPDGAFTHMSTKILQGLEFPYPSPDLQRDFLKAFGAAEVVNEAAWDSARHFDRLFSALQQRAFRGELDLSRLELDEKAETPPVTSAPEPVAIQERYKRPGSFIAPPEIEAKMMALEDKLDFGPGDSIPWSEDYFKYRILSQVLRPPFSFADIWTEVERDIEDPRYDDVREVVFKYLEEKSLEQQFDEDRREIVFVPRA